MVFVIRDSSLRRFVVGFVVCFIWRLGGIIFILL